MKTKPMTHMVRVEIVRHGRTSYVLREVRRTPMQEEEYMKIYELSPKEGVEVYRGLGLVVHVKVRAETEARARELCAELAGGDAWLNNELTECNQTSLEVEGEEGVLRFKPQAE